MGKSKIDKLREIIRVKIAPHRVLCHAHQSGRCSGMKKSDAVASVVALMLILAVVATFISLYSTSYIPGLKEQSEIKQINEVKESFMKFSGDIEHIATEKTPASYSYMIPMGGGDILLSPEKSSGTLNVIGCGNMVEVRTNPLDGANPDAVSGMVKIAFEPSYTFWEKQGYNWQYGYINVTKNEREVPLTNFTMNDILGSPAFSTFAERFVTFESEENSTSENITSLTLHVVHIVPGENSFVSGNSATTLSIIGSLKEANPQYTGYLNLSFVNNTDMPVMSEFSGHIFDYTNESLNKLYREHSNVDEPEIARGIGGHDWIQLKIDPDVLNNQVPVKIQWVNISVRM